MYERNSEGSLHHILNTTVSIKNSNDWISVLICKTDISKYLSCVTIRIFLQSKQNLWDLAERNKII